MANVVLHRTSFNETLPMISEVYYGSPNFGAAIYEANKDIIGIDPNHLNPGQDIVIPRLV